MCLPKWTTRSRLRPTTAVGRLPARDGTGPLRARILLPHSDPRPPGLRTPLRAPQGESLVHHEIGTSGWIPGEVQRRLDLAPDASVHRTIHQSPGYGFVHTAIHDDSRLAPPEPQQAPRQYLHRRFHVSPGLHRQ